MADPGFLREGAKSTGGAQNFCRKSFKTSRMRITRLLPVSPSMHWSGGGGEGVCQGRGCLPRGVSAQGGVCPDTPPRGQNRILDTRFWKYYLAPTSLRAVMKEFGSRGVSVSLAHSWIRHWFWWKMLCYIAAYRLNIHFQLLLYGHIKM